MRGREREEVSFSCRLRRDEWCADKDAMGVRFTTTKRSSLPRFASVTDVGSERREREGVAGASGRRTFQCA
jgi:hypothetical protein